MLLKLSKLLGVPNVDFGISAGSLVSDWYAIRRLLRGPRWEKSPINLGLEIPVNVGTGWIINRIKQCEGKCFGGHAAYSDHLMSILKDHDVRTIQIIRDPRDIVCSFAHWIEKRPDYYAHQTFAAMSLQEKMLAVIKGVNNGTLYFESLATVLDRSYGWITRPDDVLVVRFEDLVGPQGGGDPKAQMKTIESVAHWIGAGDADLEKVCGSLFGGTATFRKGKSGSWEDDFTPDIRSAFDKVMGDRLKFWGYE